MARILFLHGLHGSPEGTKVQLLRAAGHDVQAPTLPRDSLASALQIARDAVAAVVPDAIVGSSRGGALALSLNLVEPPPMILLAPAWVLYSPHPRIQSRTWIIHSPHDTVIPFAESELLLRRCGEPLDLLLAVGADHSLNDPAAAQALLESVSSV